MTVVENMKINLVDMDENFLTVPYDELPQIYKDNLDNMAGKIFDSAIGRIVITGPTASGKTFLTHQFVSNIDRYLDKLNTRASKSNIVFVRLTGADIRILEMGNVAPEVYVDSLAKNFDTNRPGEICFVTDDPIAMDGIMRVFPRNSAIFELNENLIRTRTGDELISNYTVINTRDLMLKKSELISLLEQTTLADMSKIFDSGIDKKVISNFVNTAIRTSPFITLPEEPKEEGEMVRKSRNPILIPNVGLWASALRRLCSFVTLSETPEIRQGGKIVMSKAINYVLEEYESQFDECVETFNQEGEEDDISNDLAALLGLGGAQQKKKRKFSENDGLTFADIDKLDELVKTEVIGQDDAINEIVDGLAVPAAGINDKGKPIRSYLFLGPTGIGKTQTAITLAKHTFETKMNVIRIDMSEYGESHEASKLIGAPPGYVGHGEGGVLTNAVRENPNSLVILDEIEKAHPRIWDSMLQVFDAGRLTDSEGETVDFTNCIIIMTSNVGAKAMNQRARGIQTKSHEQDLAARAGTAKAMMLKELEKAHFRPEFINRIDEIVVFNSLSTETARIIVRKEIGHVSERMSDNGFILDEVTDDVVDEILNLSDFAQFGARDVQRTILKNIASPIARKMIRMQREETESIANDTELADDQNKPKTAKSIINKVESVDDLVALETANDECIITLSLNNDKKIVVS